jgi:hypothetical protein
MSARKKTTLSAEDKGWYHYYGLENACDYNGWGYKGIYINPSQTVVFYMTVVN